LLIANDRDRKILMLSCRGCGSHDLAGVRGTETFAFCRQCLLVQHRGKPAATTVPSSALGLLDRVVAPDAIGSARLVVGIDAAPLLEQLAARGIQVLGVEQERAGAARARAAGVPVVEAHFGPELADALAAAGRRADLVLSPAFGRLRDPAAAVAAIARLIATDGTALIAFASAAEIVPLQAWSAAASEATLPTLRGLGALLEAEGLHLNDAGRGGRHHLLRATASTERRCTGRLAALLEEERRVGAGTVRFYSGGVPELAASRRAATEEGLGAIT
jgi:hypothetical protein